MSDNLDHLIAAAELGEESRKFLESDLGRCILGMAQQEVQAALEALEVTPANETEKIRELQFQARFGRRFEHWLHELLDEGESAMNVFKQQS